MNKQDYEILYQTEAEAGAEKKVLSAEELAALRNAEAQREKETDQLYRLYFKPELSHLAESTRDSQDKAECLSNVFRSMYGVMESWFHKYSGIKLKEATKEKLQNCLGCFRRGEWGREAPDPKVREMLLAFTKVKIYERSLEEKPNRSPEEQKHLEAKKYSLDQDRTLTEQQKIGLRSFQRWLLRNCDKTGLHGVKYGLGKKGPVRNFAEEFMKLPARVQLKALYLLETNRRKSPNENADNMNSQSDRYVPDLGNLKKTMIASKFKIFRRLNGSQFYWNKLEQAMGLARLSEKVLGTLSEKLEEHELFPENDPKKAETRRKERISFVHKAFSGTDTEHIQDIQIGRGEAAMHENAGALREEGGMNESGLQPVPEDAPVASEPEKDSAPAAKKQGTFRKLAGETWDASKLMMGYAGEVKGYYGMADNTQKIIVQDADSPLISSIGAAPAIVGAAAGVIGLAGALEGAIKSYSTATKAGVTSQVMGVAGAVGGAASGILNASSSFVNAGLSNAFKTSVPLIGAGTGVVLMAKAAMDLSTEGVNFKKAGDVLMDLRDMQSDLMKDRDKALQDISENEVMSDPEKQKAVQKERERYDRKIKELKLMEKAAKLSYADANEKEGGILRGLFGGTLLTGSSSAVAVLGALGTIGIGTGIAIPGVFLGSGVAGTIMAVEGARYADQMAERQNRRYIDADMYANSQDKTEKLAKAEKNLKDDLELWEKGSEEEKKNRTMREEAQKKSEVFQDKMRDLYAAKKGYAHQSSAKSGIKGQLFGNIYDLAFPEPNEAGNTEKERESDKRIRLNMQELLRSQGLNVRYNEGKPQDKQKQQISKEKAVAGVQKR